MTDLFEQRGFETSYYEPGEDSYLLATVCCDAISSDARVLDVGTGSGFVADRIRERTGATVVGIDVNPHACRKAHDRGVPVVQGDVVHPFRENVFDIVVCNPPYLPTDPSEHRGDWLEVALSGGASGREFVAALLEDVGRVLVPDGDLYLLVSSLMDVDAVAALAIETGFTAEEIERDDSYPDEALFVYRLS